jgi:hypothetical protein
MHQPLDDSRWPPKGMWISRGRRKIGGSSQGSSSVFIDKAIEDEGCS